MRVIYKNKGGKQHLLYLWEYLTELFINILIAIIEKLLNFVKISSKYAYDEILDDKTF
jgi:hypothetical protein